MLQKRADGINFCVMNISYISHFKLSFTPANIKKMFQVKRPSVLFCIEKVKFTAKNSYIKYGCYNYK